MVGPSAQTAPPVPTSGRRGRIFISYRRADSAGHAGRLKDDQSRLLGDRVFMDVSDIGPGADFEEVLRTELASCGVVLAIIGPRWLAAFDRPERVSTTCELNSLRRSPAETSRSCRCSSRVAVCRPARNSPAICRPRSKRQAIAIRDDRRKDDVVHLAQELRGVPKLSRLPVR